jgi:type IV secretion system protein VirB1
MDGISKSSLMTAALAIGLVLTGHAYPRTPHYPIADISPVVQLDTTAPRSDWSLPEIPSPTEPRAGAGFRRDPTSPTKRLTAASAAVLAERCAPTAPAATLVSIVKIESAFDPWTIRVNGPASAIYRPDSKAQAIQIATGLIASGRNIDVGLAQINSRNLPRLGLSVGEALDPCRNLAAAAAILNRGYEEALRRAGPDRSLLQTAYSIYNTGDGERGLANGYAAKVEAAGRLGEP